MPDKRRWTTPEQAKWLESRFPAYLEAQSRGRYDTFWPGFFQQWFEAFPASEPRSDEPTDSEHESDSDSEQTDADDNTAPSKRKHWRRNSKPSKRVRKLNIGAHEVMLLIDVMLQPTAVLPLTVEQKQLKKKGRIVRKTKAVSEMWYFYLSLRLILDNISATSTTYASTLLPFEKASH